MVCIISLIKNYEMLTVHIWSAAIGQPVDDKSGSMCLAETEHLEFAWEGCLQVKQIFMQMILS